VSLHKNDDLAILYTCFVLIIFTLKLDYHNDDDDVDDDNNRDYDEWWRFF
jgi:hypothetical protein